MTAFFEVVLRLYHAQSSSTGLWKHDPASSDAVTPAVLQMAALDVSFLVLRIFKRLSA